MGYRTVAKWEIDMTGVQNAGGWREFFGFNHLSEEFGIKFREREIRFIVRTSDLMTLTEIEHILPSLARARYRYHHRYGTGNEYNRDTEDIDLSERLENFGIRLPGWLR